MSSRCRLELSEVRYFDEFLIIITLFQLLESLIFLINDWSNKLLSRIKTLNLDLNLNLKIVEQIR